MPNTWENTYGLDPLDAADATADLDSDGATNLSEYQAGTNPQLTDTDGVEMSSGSDPLRVDTDGDGVNDGVDLRPLDARYATDSDNDGLADEWELLCFGHLYLATATYEVLSAFLTTRESLEEEARRRLPATLPGISGLPATLTAGTTYTVTWTTLSYDPSLTTMLAVFDCGAATDCGASYGEASRIATSGYLSPVRSPRAAGVTTARARRSSATASTSPRARPATWSCACTRRAPPTKPPARAASPPHPGRVGRAVRGQRWPAVVATGAVTRKPRCQPIGPSRASYPECNRR